MTRALLWVGSVAVAAGVAFVAARATAPVGAARTIHTVERPAVERVVTAVAAPVDLDAVRAVVREELRARAEDTRAPAPAEPSAEQAATGEAARELITRAVSSGQWTAADAKAWLGMQPTLHRDDRQALLRILLPAINRREVAVARDVGFPPF